MAFRFYVNYKPVETLNATFPRSIFSLNGNTLDKIIICNIPSSETSLSNKIHFRLRHYYVSKCVCMHLFFRVSGN